MAAPRHHRDAQSLSQAREAEQKFFWCFFFKKRTAFFMVASGLMGFAALCPSYNSTDIVRNAPRGASEGFLDYNYMLVKIFSKSGHEKKGGRV
jgi:hypothetical protein